MQADIIVTGTIFTGEGTIEEALAIKEKKFIYVGDRAGAETLKGAGTEVIAAQGLVLPGFTEGHAHVTNTYEILNYAHLYKGRTREEYVEIFKEFLKAHPDNEVVVGRGYRNGAFGEMGPDKSMLDEVSTEIPIIAIGEDAHSTWVNTRAMELAGLDKNSVSPENGEIVRDADGEPTGWLKEGADALIRSVLPRLTCEKIKEAILFYQKIAMYNGITHVFEPMFNPQKEYDVCCQAYEELAKSGELRICVQTGYTIYPQDDIEEEIGKAAIYRHRAQKIGSDRYCMDTIKIFIDGVLEGHTAYLSEPYQDKPGDCGSPLWTRERCNEVVKKAVESGFRVHIHTIGDGALQMAIEAFEGAKSYVKALKMPFAVTHVQVVREEQFKKLAELGVAVVVNPYWHTRDALYYDRLELPFLGKERAEKEYPVASFVKAGCVVSQASDFPVTIPMETMTGLHILVHRGEHQYGEFQPLNPGEAVTLEQALEIFTINGARQGGLEEKMGSIMSGKDADFMILDKKILTMDCKKLYTSMVKKIFIQGKSYDVEQLYSGMEEYL